MSLLQASMVGPRRLGASVLRCGSWLLRHSQNLTWSRNHLYREAPPLHLDIMRPSAPSGGLQPVVLYVHGGGFNILSKDSHAMMGVMFARRGFVVANINYRLAPRAPFPAALEDTCAAYAWVVRHIDRFGGDPQRLILAGESAGANLITALTLALCYRRPEPYAAAAHALGVLPQAVLPACGLLQVSDPGRFRRRKPHLPWWIDARLHHVTRVYLGGAVAPLELADPLCILEHQIAPARPLPPFFVGVGSRDPLLDDSRRLVTALRGLGAAAQIAYYPGGVHAFFALVWHPLARQFWQDSLRFAHASVGAGGPKMDPSAL